MTKRKQECWSKKRVLKEICKMHTRCDPLNAGAMINSLSGNNLRQAGIRYFGTWAKAVEAAGISYDSIRKIKDWRNWKEMLVVDEIKRLLVEGSALNAKFIIKRHGPLYGAAYRYFGGWPKALKAAGLDPEKHMKNKFWNKERIIKKIKELDKAKTRLDITSLRAMGMNKLIAQSYVYFGNWRKAIEAAGLDPNKIARIKPRNWWNKEFVISEILRLREAGLPLNAGFVCEYAHQIYNNAIKIFGSWENALKAAGLDTTFCRKTKKWSKEAIIESIRDLHKNGEPLNINALSIRGGAYRSLAVAGIKYFGSWDKALLAAGFNPEEIRINRPNGWWTKEKVIDEIRKIDQAGNSLKSTLVHAIRRDLYTQAYVYFDGWIDAVYSAGIDYLESCAKWSTRAWLRKAETENIDKLKEQVLRMAEEMSNHRKARKNNAHKFTVRTTRDTARSSFGAR